MFPLFSRWPVALKQTWLSNLKRLSSMCAEWMTTWVTLCSATGWRWRCWTLINQVCIVLFSCWFILYQTVCEIVLLESLTRSFLISSGLPVDWQGEPHIAVNPKPQTVRQGTKLTLRCAAFGIPTPHYQWYRNGQPLLKKTVDTLQVKKKKKRMRKECLLTSVLIVIVYTVLELLPHCG